MRPPRSCAVFLLLLKCCERSYFALHRNDWWSGTPSLDRRSRGILIFVYYNLLIEKLSVLLLFFRPQFTWYLLLRLRRAEFDISHKIPGVPFYFFFSFKSGLGFRDAKHFDSFEGNLTTASLVTCARIFIKNFIPLERKIFFSC